MNLWGQALLKHCQHAGFVFEDNAANRTIGFVCPCDPKNEKWEISLSSLMRFPKAVVKLVVVLKERQKDPNSSWFENALEKMAHAKASSESDPEFLARRKRQMKIKRKIEKLDVELKKDLSPSRRKRLQRRRAELRTEIRK